MPPRFPQFVRIGEILSIVRQTWRGGNIYITCTRGHCYNKAIVYNPRLGAINLHISTNRISCSGWNKSNIRDGGVFLVKQRSGIYIRGEHGVHCFDIWDDRCYVFDLQLMLRGGRSSSCYERQIFEYWGDLKLQEEDIEVLQPWLTVENRQRRHWRSMPMQGLALKFRVQKKEWESSIGI